MKNETKQFVVKELDSVRYALNRSLNTLTDERHFVANVCSMTDREESKETKLRILNRAIGELARISEQLDRFVNKK